MVKQFFLLLGLGVWLPLWAGLPEGYEVIVLDANASPEVIAASSELGLLLKRTYGEQPEVRKHSILNKHRGLIVGIMEEAAGSGSFPTDQIRIERTDSGLEIRGTDETATCFAVYRFIEEFLGWRLYQPGDLGYERVDEPPLPPAVEGPPEILLEETAAYYSRNLYGLGKDAQTTTWRNWNGLRERFSFNHSLHQIVTPDLFEEHPEWFARDSSGNPKRPPYSYPHGYNDHPDLSNHELRKFAAQTYAEALDDPESKIPVIRSQGMVSISLSLADSFFFGEFDDSYEWRPQGTFRRWPDWSNHVFDYTNEVAGLIEERRSSESEKLYLGALAYLSWENAPDFPVHSSVVPYLTYDRSQWSDPQAKAQDLLHISRWAKTGAPFLGTWDYLFNDGFFIPRSMSGIVSESIPELYDSGVRAYFCQTGPVWPFAAHTNWLTARLLWNPQSDPEALLDEYFLEYYGPVAPGMRAFFDKAEALWMAHSGKGWWLRYWRDPWQATLWKHQDVRELDDLLEAALADSRKLKTTRTSGLSPTRFYARVREVADLFDLSKRVWRYQQGCWELQSAQWEKLSRKELEEGQSKVEELMEIRDFLKVRLEERFPGEYPDWIFRYDCLQATAAEISSQQHTAGRQVLHDTTLSKVDNSKIWHQHFLDSQWLRTGVLPEGSGFFVENSRRGHIYQLFKADPGQDYLATADVFSRQSPSGEIYLRMDFFDAQRNLIGSSSRGRMSPSGDFVRTQRLRAFGTAPEGAVQGRLLIRFFEMDEYSRAEVYAASVRNTGPGDPR